MEALWYVLKRLGKTVRMRMFLPIPTIAYGRLGDRAINHGVDARHPRWFPAK